MIYFKVLGFAVFAACVCVCQICVHARNTSRKKQKNDLKTHKNSYQTMK